MDLSSRVKNVPVAPAAAASTTEQPQQTSSQKTETKQPPSVDQLFARKELISKPEQRNKKAKKEDVSGAAGKTKEDDKKSPYGKKKRHLSHKKDPIGRDEIKRTVFVGNLPNTITHAQVERFFEQKCGDPKSDEAVVEAARVRCVHLAPIEEGQKDRGRGVRILRGEIDKNEAASATAYVVFTTIDAADAAIDMSGVVFKERHLSIGGETPEAKAFAPRSSVYLGNLPYNVTDEQIWRFFIDHELADVTRVRIPRDHNSSAWGNAKGFGYVEFRSRESVVKALKLRDPRLEDRKIRIFSVHKSKDAIGGQVTRREKRAVVSASAGKKVSPNNNNNNQNQNKKQNNNNNQEGGEENNSNKKNAINASNGSRGKKTAVGAMALNAQAHETPSWMGQTTDPRKKLSKELRWLSQHPNDRKAAAKARHKDRVMANFVKRKKAAKAE